MKHFFLTSAIGIPGITESIRVKLGHNRKMKTAFITTPVEVEDMTDDDWYQADRAALIKNGFAIYDYTITGKKLEDFKTDLFDTETIYISGGNTRHLLEQSHLSGFDQFVKTFVNSGKLYLSTSAGSIIAGPVLPKYLWGEEVDAPHVGDFSAYSLVNFTLIPHWGSVDFRRLYLEGRMSEIYSDTLQPFILCTDNEYIEVLDDKYQIIDIRNEK